MLNDTERKILAGFLDQLGEHMGNAGCNDFDLPDTLEGRKLAEEVEAFENEHPCSPPPMWCMDFKVLGLLRNKLGI